MELNIVKRARVQRRTAIKEFLGESFANSEVYILVEERLTTTMVKYKGYAFGERFAATNSTLE